MITVATFFYAWLAWLRPRLALGVLIFVIPFGHLVRWVIAGIPFTFVEMATYTLAIAVCVSHRARERPLPSHSPSTGEGREHHSPNSLPEEGCGGVDDCTTHDSRRTNVLRDPWVLLPILWILIAAIAAVGSPGGLRAWGIWRSYFVAPVVLFWVLRGLLRQSSSTSSTGSGDHRNFSLLPCDFLLPIAASALGVAAIAGLQHWFPIGVPYPWSVPGKFRATSVFGYPNAVGLYLAPLVPLILGAALSHSSSLRVQRSRAAVKENVVEQPHVVGPLNHGAESFAMFGVTLHVVPYFVLLTSILSLLAIVLARSTGALVALGAMVPLLVWERWLMHRGTSKPQVVHDTHIHDREERRGPRRAMRWAVMVVGAWVAASLVLTAWLPYRREQPKWGPPIVQELTFQRWSGSVRLSQYRETWALLRNHPIRGAGLAGYQTAIAPYHEDRRVEIFLYPHNLLLAVWVELGLAGLIVFLAIMYQFFRKCFSVLPMGRKSDLSKPERRKHGWTWCGIAAAMFVILTHGLVDVPYFKNDLAMLFWMIVALAVVARRSVLPRDSSRGAPAPLCARTPTPSPQHGCTIG